MSNIILKIKIITYNYKGVKHKKNEETNGEKQVNWVLFLKPEWNLNQTIKLKISLIIFITVTS